MNSALDDPFDDLSDRAGGRVLRPGDDVYDRARRVWNGRIDREPAAIVRAAGSEDVVAAVDAARR